jgi:DNA-binding MarR family transcriptional regulator
MSIEVQGPGEVGADASAVNRDILDSLSSLIKLVGGVAQGISAEFGIAPHDLLAMFKLDSTASMKELAQHMGCDASFITTVADTLERRGFVRREPSQRDRRVKNLVLTQEGIAAKERLMGELAVKMPWSYALDDAERCCFLALLRRALGGARSDVCLDEETRAGDAKPRARSGQI